MTVINEGWLPCFTNFFDKMSAGSGVANNEIKRNLQFGEELQKPTITSFKKRTVYSEFKGNIWVLI